MSRTLRNIEEKMKDLDSGSIRYLVLESAKNFKASWVELGRSLYTVHKDKLYKNWEYGTFEAYVAKEIGIRKETAAKLMRSYFFLEKEEPRYLRPDYLQQADAAAVPGYESIDVLRLAKNKKGLDKEEYDNFKRDIFDGKDHREVKKDLTALIRQRQELDPEEAQEKRRLATVKRLIGTLKSLKKEVELLKLVSAPVIRDAASLIQKLEAEIR